tara:strand:+ start:5817 stop:6224 length:408 start_codon:yes stop_codon:yes gene_type:complete
MKLHTFLIGLVLFMTIIVTGWTFFADMADVYQVSYNSSQLSDFDQSAQVNDLVANISEDVRGSPVGEDSDTTYSFISGSFGAVKLIFNAFPLANEIIQMTGDWLNIDEIWISLAYISIILIVLFIIINSVLNIRY